VAGPIVRASEFAPQLRVRPDPRCVPSGEAFRLIAFGLFKKVVVSSYVASAIVDPVFGAPAAHGPLDLLVGVYAYAIQIYADFSGYTDIAIGCALLLGIRFPQNFDAPYRSLSLQEFWRRWHMTLSAWFRDYVYVPLGGNRGSRRRTYINLVTVFFLCGLWHGASWTFVVWGLFHGAFLVLERLGLAALVGRLPAPLRHAYLLLVVMVGWVFFRSESIAQAWAFLQALAGKAAGTPTPFLVAWHLTPELWLALGAAAIGAMPVGPALARWRAAALGDTARPARAWGVAAFSVISLAAILLLSIVQVAARTYNPFIYFRF
jgi:alginate O-acetyltransferase complex protein AlgI